MSHPLEGIRVLDLTRLLPGGVCTMMLADLGATIIKVEDPNGGDYARWMPPTIHDQGVYFRMNNRGKQSIILDLKAAGGQAVLKKLVEGADVLVESFRPNVLARLNCGYDALRAINPKLVYCSLSGWGADGPYVERSGHDLNYVSLAGLTGAMGTPQVMGGQIADIGGAMIGVAGILAALLRRERTGEGGFVEAALAEAALPFALYNWTEALMTGARGGEGGLTGGLACYRVYPTRDGKHVALGALEPKFWQNFCNAVGRPDLIDNYLDPTRQEYLRVELGGIFTMRTLAEWDQALGSVDCCFSVVNTPAQVSSDPHFTARGMLGQFADGTPWMRSPIRISGSEPTLRNDVPSYGADTRAVLSAAGYSAEEIEELLTNSIAVEKS